jgi:hypothetical protein
MLEADRGQADAFDLDGDPENGAIAPGDIRSLRNMSGYLPHTWMKAHTQVQSYRGMLASLLGNLQLTVITYHHFLHVYDQVFTRLKGELDSAYGWRLAPCLVNFHVQLMVRN